MHSRLVVYPAILGLSLIIASILVILFSPVVFISYKWESERRSVGWLFNPLLKEELFQSPYLDSIPLEPVPLASLPEEVSSGISEELYFEPRSEDGYLDSWKNPYFVVSLNDDGHRWYGVFSTGADGISRTAGNDPDDINSWGQNGDDYYPARIAHSHRMEFFRNVGLTAIFIVAPVLAMIHEARRRKATQPPTPPANKPLDANP